MPRKKQPNRLELESSHFCHVTGCKAPGEYKAPSSKDMLREWCWYCLDHIREHNKKWDFFSGMQQAQIEAFMKDALTGHRPTWTREGKSRPTFEDLRAALHEFMHNKEKSDLPKSPSPVRLNSALAVLGMDYPYTAQGLKSRYRKLVKQHHPDVNKGDKKSEEQFKKITAAYRTLSEYLEKSA